MEPGLRIGEWCASALPARRTWIDEPDMSCSIARKMSREFTLEKKESHCGPPRGACRHFRANSSLAFERK